jgi:hypothetical protein
VSGQTLNAEVLAVAPSQAVQNAVQEGKLHSACQALKEHVRGSDPKFARVFPVKNSKIILSPPHENRGVSLAHGHRSG